MEDEKIIDNLDDKKEEDKKEDKKEENKTFTQDEVNEIVKKRLKRELDDFKKQFKQDLDKEKNEAERLAKMTEEERKQEEWKKEKETFDNERKAFLKEKLEIQTMKELSKIGVPAEFSSFVISDTAEETNTKMKTFKEKWDEAIEKAVNEKLKGKTPTTSNKTGVTLTVTKEEFRKMNYRQKLEVQAKDPDLFNELMKG